MPQVATARERSTTAGFPKSCRWSCASEVTLLCRQAGALHTFASEVIAESQEFVRCSAVGGKCEHAECVQGLRRNILGSCAANGQLAPVTWDEFSEFGPVVAITCGLAGQTLLAAVMCADSGENRASSATLGLSCSRARSAWVPKLFHFCTICRSFHPSRREPALDPAQTIQALTSATGQVEGHARPARPARPRC